ncbi:MAG: gamma-glutamyltransferase [Phycisphaerae bacterium]|nr:gamma-glutamyltransferase [Phycisphaerae bacterium]MCZ2399996.1 gamma-glutamyltransferase [Phycisphaerae bacterium]NUQ49105.1 gamma-glutamyltransferase [Phycisphaerae bacterium]
MTHCLIAGICLVLLAPLAFAGGGDRITGRAFATRSEVIARNGAAATSHPLATQAAVDVLKAGGSAVDAAIAANACLALMEPTGCGLGGDLFAIVWDPKTKKLYGLNASGRSPLGLSREELTRLVGGADKQIPSHGPLPISVPGCVDGWFELHRRFGRLPMAQVLAPAIRYAREGFPVTQLIAYYWQRSEPLKRYPGFADTFLPGGRAPREGEIFRNPGLADTLEKLAAEGRDAFYAGEIARRMDAFCRENGCFLRMEDFEQHTSTWLEPVSTSYRGYDVWELPPNGQGIAALQILSILEGFDVRAMGLNGPAYLHTVIEAKKLAFEDRARYYADPDFAQIPIERLLSKEYAAERRKLIDPRRAARRYPAGDIGLGEADARLRDGDTIYLATADAERMMVSLINSNYRGFGSGLCPPGLGFGFQDRGEMFSLKEGHPNVYEPGKRPFHTIIPAFLTKDGEPLMAFGVMGGDMQPQGHVQIVCNLVDFGLNVQEAGDAARWYHTGSSEPTGPVMRDGGTVSLESGIDAETVRELASLGHRIQHAIGPYGGYQAIWYDAANDVYRAASESRKDGQAAGY